jgi:hypothetical protein
MDLSPVKINTSRIVCAPLDAVSAGCGSALTINIVVSHTGYKEQRIPVIVCIGNRGYNRPSTLALTQLESLRRYSRRQGERAYHVRSVNVAKLLSKNFSRTGMP